MTRESDAAFDKTHNTGFTHLANATRFSIRGLREAFRRESAFRQELALCAFALPLAVWVGESPLVVAVLVAVCLLVIMVELLNSAIEAVVDRVGPERHPLSGLAKDLGSAAVMVALLIAGLVWAAALYERLGPL